MPEPRTLMDKTPARFPGAMLGRSPRHAPPPRDPELEAIFAKHFSGPPTWPLAVAAAVFFLALLSAMATGQFDWSAQ